VLNEKLSDVKDMASSLLNIDIKKTPLKIIPAQHYMMGGILININCETSIQNLYSAGECSCLSVHGANRLGGNSLIECLVFGKIAGEQISHYDKNTKVDINSIDFDEYIGRPAERYIEDVENLLNNIDLEYVSNSCTKLQSLMTSNVGILRTNELLNKALSELSIIKTQLLSNSSNNPNNFEYSVFHYFELLNMLDVAEAIVSSSLLREESRGSHFRLDFPLRNDKDWLSHVLVQLSNSNLKTSLEPVVINDIFPDSRTY
jgi:succinate dehydrogenase / fumarate reductase flavoprotein subunit